MCKCILYSGTFLGIKHLKRTNLFNLQFHKLEKNTMYQSLGQKINHKCTSIWKDGSKRSPLVEGKCTDIISRSTSGDLVPRQNLLLLSLWLSSLKKGVVDIDVSKKNKYWKKMKWKSNKKILNAKRRCMMSLERSPLPLVLPSSLVVESWWCYALFGNDEEN